MFFSFLPLSILQSIYQPLKPLALWEEMDIEIMLTAQNRRQKRFGIRSEEKQADDCDVKN
ncbi:MAG TPA: hypothetical protein ENK58_02975 [Desulfobacterales bacterium]|nr:hypothetical protein [Desulfobacterales bacterium]